MYVRVRVIVYLVDLSVLSLALSWDTSTRMRRRFIFGIHTHTKNPFWHVLGWGACLDCMIEIPWVFYDLMSFSLLLFLASSSGARGNN